MRDLPSGPPIFGSSALAGIPWIIDCEKRQMCKTLLSAFCRPWTTEYRVVGDGSTAISLAVY